MKSLFGFILVLTFIGCNTKSLSAIMTGIAIEQGKIKDVNQRMLDFFPDYSSRSEDTLKSQILLSMDYYI